MLLVGSIGSAARYYDTLGLRPTGHVELLVREEDSTRAVRALGSAGWSTRGGARPARAAPLALFDDAGNMLCLLRTTLAPDFVVETERAGRSAFLGRCRRCRRRTACLSALFSHATTCSRRSSPARARSRVAYDPVDRRRRDDRSRAGSDRLAAPLPDRRRARPGAPSARCARLPSAAAGTSLPPAVQTAARPARRRPFANDSSTHAPPGRCLDWARCPELSPSISARQRDARHMRPQRGLPGFFRDRWQVAARLAAAGSGRTTRHPERRAAISRPGRA